MTTNHQHPRTASDLPQWLAERLRPMPPVRLRSVPLPEWSAADRAAFEPAGHVWDRNRQQWVTG